MKTIGLMFFAVHLAATAAGPSYAVVDKIAIGGEARWDYLAIDGTRRRLYVSHGSQTEVIDTTNDTVVTTISDTPGVHGIAIADDLGLGYISNGKDDSVTVFDLATSKPRARIKVGSNPDAIVYDPKSHRVVTFNGKSHDVTVIDAKEASMVGTLPVGGKPEFAQLGSDGIIYFNIEDTNELAALDPGAIKLLHRHSLSPCESPSGLAIDDRQRLYSVCENGLIVVSASDGTRIAQAPIGGGSDGVVWLGGHAYSANGADGTISVVTLTGSQNAAVVETIASARGARTIAADPGSRRLFLPTADYPPAAAGVKAAGKPGTFHVLVLAP